MVMVVNGEEEDDGEDFDGDDDVESYLYEVECVDCFGNCGSLFWE